MNDATKILEMIEAVDPVDTDMLDEIDARVCAFLKFHDGFKVSFAGGSIYYRHNSWEPESRTQLLHLFDNFQYTRSRDALKEVRPVGWFFQLVPCANGKWMCDSNYYEPFKAIHVHPLPTEELAELHAIIQAIQYERDQND